MKQKNERYQFILKIIKEHHIYTQDQLLGLLKQNGFDVTQATLSRDLKILQVGKLSDGVQHYYAVVSSMQEAQARDVLVTSVLSIDFSGKLCVMATLPGYASAVTAAIDTCEMLDIIGTIAGDNNILLVLSETTTVEKFYSTLISHFPELDEKLNNLHKSQNSWKPDLPLK